LFFALSKTIGIMLLPINLLILLGVLGVLLLVTRWARFGRFLLVASMLLLALCGFTPLGNLLLYPLETRFPTWDASRGAPDGIVVLGGGIDADPSAAHGEAVFTSSAARVIIAAVLAHRYPQARILYSGGSANFVSDTSAREADYALRILEDLGVAKDRLIIESESRNTFENAFYSKALAQPKPGERWLLVTSAFHMPRSVGVFRKVGFAVEPFPVDWRLPARKDLFRPLSSSEDGLGHTNLAIREWLGLVAYRVTGRTDELLPGPATN
jgi:uncharacterized SAM-binding protein YcdF (DUF218 family)